MSKREFTKFIIKAVSLAQKEEKLPSFDTPQVLVEFSERGEHGDYSTNIALLLGKKIDKSPIEVAKILVHYLKDYSGRVEAVEPGFINFWLSDKELLDSLKRILEERDRFGSAKEQKIVVIDYSAPNIAKPFGIGHLRSTIIGQAIYNIYKFMGWECIGDNHLGDWGTQFGKLIVAIKKWSKKELEKLLVDDLEELYVRFHKESAKNEQLLEEARKWFRKLEKGDEEAKRIWRICVDISLKNFDKVYALLNIKIDKTLGESFYEDKIKAVIKEAREKGVVEKSRGALVIPLLGTKIPLMLLKSDGATTYGARDLATIKYRLDKWKPNLIIWEVGAEQEFYFEQIFEAAEILGYGKKEQFVHIAHGLIRWSHGKFSTRKGDTIHLEDILKEAIERARKIIDGSKTAEGMSEDERKETAEQIGIGAIKYNDLSRHYSRDIIFNWENILSLEGNSGPYLQYTTIRCQSVLKKAKSSGKVEASDINKEEEGVLRVIRRFPEIVQNAGDSFSPNLICNFAFDLARQYNVFYEKHSILEAETKEKEAFRLALTEATRQVLKNSLELLGISIPLRM